MKSETRKHGLTELSFNELSEINGGESGWYYLGKAARWLKERFWDDNYDGPRGIGDPMNIPG